MRKTKVLWNGITGRTGVQAQIASKTCECSEIVAGVCRNNENYYNKAGKNYQHERKHVFCKYAFEHCPSPFPKN